MKLVENINIWPSQAAQETVPASRPSQSETQNSAIEEIKFNCRYDKG